MMYFILVCAIFTVFGTTTALPFVSDDSTNDDCTSAGVNGVLEIGCWGYKECLNGKLIKHTCPPGEVFERDSMKCIKEGQGNTECHKLNACADKDDGMYADVGDNCESYYRCFGKTFLGHLYCPATLIFNEPIQACDYKGNVKKGPCSTPVVG